MPTDREGQLLLCLTVLLPITNILKKPTFQGGLINLTK